MALAGRTSGASKRTVRHGEPEDHRRRQRNERRDQRQQVCLGTHPVGLGATNASVKDRDHVRRFRSRLAIGNIGVVIRVGVVLTGVSQEVDPDFPLFLGGMLAGICLAVAGLVYVVAVPGSPALALAYGFAALGAIFFSVGALAAAGLWVYT
jgi:hypothetical protein